MGLSSPGPLLAASILKVEPPFKFRLVLRPGKAYRMRGGSS
ncbi:hypothetical protein I603_1703 [Erythrobacter dokdonensis DSW-74]|uniref:Uncharacterized protein n=1 Tax=Erythrobacter dokdonensis DSW-74 TaxID=1300349 RepID=A0A1A7BJC5_9SPHN|nr:hypothetical protein I603_1703 [Erythrobacter dokdonensis DSW-74]